MGAEVVAMLIGAAIGLVLVGVAAAAAYWLGP